MAAATPAAVAMAAAVTAMAAAATATAAAVTRKKRNHNLEETGRRTVRLGERIGTEILEKIKSSPGGAHGMSTWGEHMR